MIDSVVHSRATTQSFRTPHIIQLIAGLGMLIPMHHARLTKNLLI